MTDDLDFMNEVLEQEATEEITGVTFEYKEIEVEKPLEKKVVSIATTKDEPIYISVPVPTQEVIVSAKDYGIDEIKAKEIEGVFLPLELERGVLTQMYSEIITEELSVELCGKARELRLKLVKVRTGTEKIHKSQKAFFLAGGRYVDAWKNKTVVAVELMESKLLEVENYFINIEKQKIKQLGITRKELLSGICEDTSMYPLETMSEKDFEVLKTVLTNSYNLVKEEEARIHLESENLRLELMVFEARRTEIMPFYQFLTPEQQEINYGTLTELEWSDFTDLLVIAKLDYEKKQAKLKADNEQLQKELSESIAINEVVTAKLSEVELKQDVSLGFRNNAPQTTIYVDDRIALKDYIYNLNSIVPKVSAENAEVRRNIMTKLDEFKEYAIMQINTIN